MAIAPEQIGIGIRRHFTEPGTHPYDLAEWELREARIPNFKDGTEIKRMPNTKMVRVIAFSPSGKLLATGGDQKNVMFWDVEKGEGAVKLLWRNACISAPMASSPSSPAKSKLAKAPERNSLRLRRKNWG